MTRKKYTKPEVVELTANDVWDRLREQDASLATIVGEWSKLNRFDKAIIFRKWPTLAGLLETEETANG